MSAAILCTVARCKRLRHQKSRHHCERHMRLAIAGTAFMYLAAALACSLVVEVVLRAIR